MRILVTGINGFTGHYVKTALQNSGHEVVGLVSDLRDYDALALEIKALNPSAVIHLAAIAFVGHGNANAFYEVNLIGSRNLLEALSQHAPEVKSILLASSANIYGNRSEGSIGEDALPDPANDYAVSKYSMELMGKLWSNTLPITFTRPFNYTGVGQSSDFLIPKIIAHFKAKKSIIELGNLDVWREFNDVRFIADSYVKLIEQTSLPSGQAVNICTGKAYSLREVIALCEEISNHKIELHVNPQFVRENEVRVLKGSKKLLEQTINSNTEYDLKQTLKWMLGIEK